MIAISRAHGQGDLYLQNCTEQLRPLVKLQNQVLNKVFAVSEAGKEYLKVQGVKAVSYTHLDVYKRQVYRKDPGEKTKSTLPLGIIRWQAKLNTASRI